MALKTEVFITKNRFSYSCILAQSHFCLQNIPPPKKKKNPNLFYSESSYPERMHRKNVEFLSFSVSLGGYTLLFKHLSLLCVKDVSSVQVRP